MASVSFLSRHHSNDNKYNKKEKIINFFRRFFLRLAANSKNKDGVTQLMVAAKEGETRILMSMIEGGGDVNANDKDDFTALMFAAARGHVDCVKVLLTVGANINAKDRWGRTAIMAAEEGAKDTVVAVLKAAGAKD